MREATPDDLEPLGHLAADAFGGTFDRDELEAAQLVFEPERNHVAVRDGRVVANLGAFTRELTVPGAVLPAAHVTLAAVRPEHHRRGLLTRLMDRQLSTVPESIAVLWASEGRIYQRFGYGMAAANLSCEIDTRELRLAPYAPEPDPDGEICDAVPADARESVKQVYERVRRDRPGWSGRSDRWWEQHFCDPKESRGGAGPKRLSLYVTEAGVDGYALWRVKSVWTNGSPDGEVHAIDVVGATPQAYTALWRHLLSVDLTRRVVVNFAAVDEPLRYLVNEPRMLRSVVGDGLWLRLVDVPAALAGRRYAAPVDTVVEVVDAVIPANAGRYRLRAEPDEPAECVPTTADAEVTCDVTALAAAYLGGVSLARLADTGRVTELRPGALPQVSRAFGWHRCPAPSDMF